MNLLWLISLAWCRDMGGAFQPPVRPRRLPSTITSRHLLPADSASMIISSEAMLTDLDSIVAPLMDDPLVLAAGCVAVLSLLGLAYTGSMNDDNDDSTGTTTRDVSSSSNRPKQISVPAPTYQQSRSGGGGGEREPIVPQPPDSPPPLGAVETKTDPTLETAAKQVDKVTEEDEEEGLALKAFEERNRSVFRDALTGLVGKLTTSRRKLDEESKLRHRAEAKLRAAAVEMTELEDKYELGQNDLQRVNDQLQHTTDLLQRTDKDLQTTLRSLSELQSERRSIRKLSRVIWKLSKERTQKRVRTIGDRLKRKGGSSKE